MNAVGNFITGLVFCGSLIGGWFYFMDHVVPSWWRWLKNKANRFIDWID